MPQPPSRQLVQRCFHRFFILVHLDATSMIFLLDSQEAVADGHHLTDILRKLDSDDRTPVATVMSAVTKPGDSGSARALATYTREFPLFRMAFLMSCLLFVWRKCFSEIKLLEKAKYNAFIFHPSVGHLCNSFFADCTSGSGRLSYSLLCISFALPTSSWRRPMASSTRLGPFEFNSCREAHTHGSFGGALSRPDI